MEYGHGEVVGDGGLVVPYRCAQQTRSTPAAFLIAPPPHTPAQPGFSSSASSSRFLFLSPEHHLLIHGTAMIAAAAAADREMRGGLRREGTALVRQNKCLAEDARLLLPQICPPPIQPILRG